MHTKRLFNADKNQTSYEDAVKQVLASKPVDVIEESAEHVSALCEDLKALSSTCKDEAEFARVLLNALNETVMASANKMDYMKTMSLIKRGL